MTTQLSLFTQFAENFGQYFTHPLAEPTTEESYKSCCVQAAEGLLEHIDRGFVHKEIVVQACVTPLREPFASGNATFDAASKRSSPLMTGNVSSNIQTSSFIRRMNDTHCNGHNFEFGELRRADAKWVDSRRVSGRGVRYEGCDTAFQWLNKHYNKEVILYCVFHPKAKRDDMGERELRIHGWVLTDRRGNRLESRVQGDSDIMRRAVLTFTHYREEPESLVPGNPDGVLYKVSNGSLRFVHADLLSAMSEQDRERVRQLCEVPQNAFEIEQVLQKLGIAVCCDIADEIDSHWYQSVCDAEAKDDAFIKELSKRLEGGHLWLDIRDRFQNVLSPAERPRD